MTLMKKAKLLILFLTLAATPFARADDSFQYTQSAYQSATTTNVSRGWYASYIDGSKARYDTPADKVQAHFKLSYIPPSEYLNVPQIDLFLEMKSGDVGKIRLAPLVPDNVQMLDDDKVLIMSSRGENALAVTSDNPKLQADTESVFMTVKEVKAGSTRCSEIHRSRQNLGSKQCLCTYADEYKVAIRLYDADISKKEVLFRWPKHILGRFDGTITYTQEWGGSCNGSFSPGPESGRGLFRWLRAHAKND